MLILGAKGPDHSAIGGCVCEPHNITKNTNEHKERFIEGRDYYKLEGVELQEFKRVLTDIPEPLELRNTK